MWWIFLIIISIAPVYFLGSKIYKSDYEKESTKLLIKLFVFGILSIAVTYLISNILISIMPFFDFKSISEKNIITLLIQIFIGIALIEEFSKWIFVYSGTYNHLEFNHAYDAIVYAVFVSLGFACLENCMYVLSSSNSVQIAILRSVSAIPGHVSFGIFMGYYLGLAKIADKNGNRKISRKNKILSFVMPVILHGLYDYFALATMFSGIFLILFILFIIWMFKSAIVKVKQLSSLIHNIGEEVKIKQAAIYVHQISTYGYNFCPRCGDRVRGNFCRVCGLQHAKQQNDSKIA